MAVWLELILAYYDVFLGEKLAQYLICDTQERQTGWLVWDALICQVHFIFATTTDGKNSDFEKCLITVPHTHTHTPAKSFSD